MESLSLHIGSQTFFDHLHWVLNHTTDLVCNQQLKLQVLVFTSCLKFILTICFWLWSGIFYWIFFKPPSDTRTPIIISKQTDDIFTAFFGSCFNVRFIPNIIYFVYNDWYFRRNNNFFIFKLYRIFFLFNNINVPTNKWFNQTDTFLTFTDGLFMFMSFNIFLSVYHTN